MNKKSIILLSGGLDSATCAAIAKSKGFDLYALSFDYGQRHKFELGSAKKIVSHFQIKNHKIITIDLKQFGGSALTSEIAVPKGSISKNGVPITYVPARNIIFLSYALGWANIVGCHDIFIGANAVDYSGYPDCRPDFIKAFEKMANLGTKEGSFGHKITIHAPLINMSKAEIIKTGISLGVDYSLTHTCYDPKSDGSPCKECEACLLRKKGFDKAGICDPILF